MQRIVIIGGGITGLAAAHRLVRLTGSDPAHIRLFERDDRLGGKIRTERVDGFVIEGGPDTFLAHKPRGVGLCRELGLADRLHGTNRAARRTYVLRSGRLQTLPEGLTGLIPTRVGPLVRTSLLSPLGKLRLGWEYFVPARRDGRDETLAEFVGRRLGRDMYDHVIEPLMSGIYAGEGAQLSLGATFPQLALAERQHGGLLRSLLAARMTASSPPPATGGQSAFLTPTTGLAEIVEALERNLTGVQIQRGLAVKVLTPTPGGFQLELSSGETLAADAVIAATPAYVTADLVSGFDPEMARYLYGIPYASTATISLAYPLDAIPRPLDGYGYVVPRAEGRAILACTWTSTKFPHRAPSGYALVRAFVGRAGADDAVAASDAQLLTLVREELREVMGVTVAPALHRIYRWSRAMPQYTLGHLDRVGAIQRCLANHRGLYVAGSAYTGIGIPDCIHSGETAAGAAHAYVRSSSRAIHDPASSRAGG